MHAAPTATASASSLPDAVRCVVLVADMARLPTRLLEGLDARGVDRQVVSSPEAVMRLLGGPRVHTLILDDLTPTSLVDELLLAVGLFHPTVAVWQYGSEQSRRPGLARIEPQVPLRPCYETLTALPLTHPAPDPVEAVSAQMGPLLTDAELDMLLEPLELDADRLELEDEMDPHERALFEEPPITMRLADYQSPASLPGTTTRDTRQDARPEARDPQSQG